MSIKKILLNAAMPTLKQLVNALLTAWRGSHKSVIAGNYIATDLKVARGYSNIQKLYTAPSDGVLAAQTPTPSTAILLRQGEKWIWRRLHPLAVGRLPLCHCEKVRSAGAQCMAKPVRRICISASTPTLAPNLTLGGAL